MKYLTFNISGWAARGTKQVYEDGVIEGSNFIYMPIDVAVRKTEDVINQLCIDSYGAKVIFAKAYLRANPGYAGCDTFFSEDDTISVRLKLGESTKIGLLFCAEELWALAHIEELSYIETPLHEFVKALKTVQRYQPLQLEEDQE